jgi:hypothetical protein
MSTDYLPKPSIPYAHLRQVLKQVGFYVGSKSLVSTYQCLILDENRCSITLDGKNFLYAHRIPGADYLRGQKIENPGEGCVNFTRFGQNDVEPILRFIENHFSVIIGPEHAREAYADDPPKQVSILLATAGDVRADDSILTADSLRALEDNVTLFYSDLTGELRYKGPAPE